MSVYVKVIRITPTYLTYYCTDENKRCAKMYQCVQKLPLRFLTLFSWLYKLCQLTYGLQLFNLFLWLLSYSLLAFWYHSLPYVKRGLLRFVINTWPQEQLTFLILTIPPQPGHALHKGMLEILERRDISPTEKRSESDTQSIKLSRSLKISSARTCDYARVTDHVR